jgi:hypothetical protein
VANQQSPRSRYQVIAASVLPADVEEADRIAEALRHEGWPHASRSLVIREALARLSEDLLGKTTEETFRDFIDRRARRIPNVAGLPTARIDRQGAHAPSGLSDGRDVATDDRLWLNCGRCGKSLSVRVQDVQNKRTINCEACEKICRTSP